MLTTITKIPNIPAFIDLLNNNPGIIILKFGATWCGPCTRIEPLIERWFSQMPDTVQTCIIDIDENFVLYSFLKSKKRINGVPALMCYFKGNVHYIPNDMVVGSDVKQINEFFNRSLQKLSFQRMPIT